MFGISMFTIKQFASTLIEQLYMITNKSLYETGKIPEQLKISKVFPINQYQTIIVL